MPVNRDRRRVTVSPMKILETRPLAVLVLAKFYYKTHEGEEGEGGEQLWLPRTCITTDPPNGENQLGAKVVALPRWLVEDKESMIARLYGHRLVSLT